MDELKVRVCWRRLSMAAVQRQATKDLEVFPDSDGGLSVRSVLCCVAAGTECINVDPASGWRLFRHRALQAVEPEKTTPRRSDSEKCARLDRSITQMVD